MGPGIRREREQVIACSLAISRFLEFYCPTLEECNREDPATTGCKVSAWCECWTGAGELYRRVLECLFVRDHLMHHTYHTYTSFSIFMFGWALWLINEVEDQASSAAAPPTLFTTVAIDIWMFSPSPRWSTGLMGRKNDLPSNRRRLYACEPSMRAESLTQRLLESFRPSRIQKTTWNAGICHPRCIN
jgi:hypothetical protein